MLFVCCCCLVGLLNCLGFGFDFLVLFVCCFAGMEFVLFVLVVVVVYSLGVSCFTVLCAWIMGIGVSVSYCGFI